MPTKRKQKEQEKIYPSLVLGLDISTSCIGVSIVYDDGVSEPEIRLITHIVPKIPSHIKGIEALIMRKDIFNDEFLSTIKEDGITECVIESPLNHSTASSNAQTVAQLLQFNGLLSDAVYKTLGIIPNYISSYEARMLSFPKLLSIRKFNKKGEQYSVKQVETAIKNNHLVLFGSFPFDCDKKTVMMNCVCEKYPNLNWVYNTKGELKKENYDASDSLICALAYINQKKYGELNAEIVDCTKTFPNDKQTRFDYDVRIWEQIYKGSIVLNNA